MAASAAYPVFLPALDRKYAFEKQGETRTVRVLLTDGGVFENLGVSPMEPGRNPSISTNIFDPDYIISCDAGAGLLDDDSFSSLVDDSDDAFLPHHVQKGPGRDTKAASPAR